MKMSDVLNEAPKKKPVNKDSWVKKADDAVRKSFPALPFLYSLNST